MANTINDNFGSGGATLAPQTDDTAQPSLKDILQGLADDLEQITSFGVMTGLALSAPSSASAQLTGTGNTTWNVKVEAGTCVVSGTSKVFAEQDDFDIHSGSFLAGFVNGASCIATLVAKNVSGTITTVAVVGTPATTGQEVAPTDAEIQAEVGAANTWTKLGETTLNRTGDTTVTQTYDNSKKAFATGLEGHTLSLLRGTGS